MKISCFIIQIEKDIIEKHTCFLHEIDVYSKNLLQKSHTATKNIYMQNIQSQNKQDQTKGSL